MPLLFTFGFAHQSVSLLERFPAVASGKPAGRSAMVTEPIMTVTTACELVNNLINNRAALLT
jgi:hypothetical protein